MLVASSLESAGRVAAVLIGVGAAAWFLTSAIRTIVIPRPERVWITTTAFRTGRAIARWFAARTNSAATKHRILGSFAPVVLLVLPAVWSLGLIGSFAMIFWGVAGGSVMGAVELSGSSLTTLGFIEAPNLATRLIAIVEALLGLAIVALLISFLPTLYSTFSRREVAVGRLTTRAGEPPDPVEFIVRMNAIDRLAQIGERWDEWENWFVELGETHTSFPALVHFRSARPGRSWLTAAETALDTAALVTCTGLAPVSGQAETMIRSGYLALRSIADYYEVQPERDASLCTTELSIDRTMFDEMCDSLASNGISLEVNRDDAWERFAGWRVNYDQSVVGLRELISEVPSHWDEPPHPERVG